MDRRRGILLAAAGFTCWGLLSPGNEILLRQYDPLWMQVVRSVLASTVLIAWVGMDGLRDALRVFRHRRLRLALFWGTFISFALFALAQDRIPATFATLGFYTSPLWTAVFGRFFGERLGPWFAPSILAMLFGAWLALTDAGTAWPDWLGMAMAVGAGATWAVFAVLLRRSSADVEWKPLLLASMLLATPLFIVLALVFEPWPAWGDFTQETWFWTGVQVAIPTLLAMGLFQNALRYAPASQVNLLVGCELAGTVVFAYLLLGARFTGLQLMGVLLVLLSVTFYLAKAPHEAPPGHEAPGA